MSKNYKDLNQEQRQCNLNYRKMSPTTFEAFIGLHKAAMQEGQLSVKQKELMACAIAVAARCDGCIAAHVASAIKAGASRQELVEAIDVAILMGGGPAFTYGAQALTAMESLFEQ